jgi:hypothetical protein
MRHVPARLNRPANTMPGSSGCLVRMTSILVATRHLCAAAQTLDSAMRRAGGPCHQHQHRQDSFQGLHPVRLQHPATLATRNRTTPPYAHHMPRGPKPPTSVLQAHSTGGTLEEHRRYYGILALGCRSIASVPPVFLQCNTLAGGLRGRILGRRDRRRWAGGAKERI